MADVQITCVLKTANDHATITHVGGVGGGGWCWTKQQVIDSIEAPGGPTNTFYTMKGGKRADVYVVNSVPKYLRTYADGVWSNNLIELPGCP